MPSIGRNTKRSRLDQMTDQELQQRWAALFPQCILGGSICAAVSVAVFLYNHLCKPTQHVTDLLTVVFQISTVFTVCFVFLAAERFYGSRADHPLVPSVDEYYGALGPMNSVYCRDPTAT